MKSLARAWAPLLAAVVVLSLTPSVAAHSMGSGYFAHRFEVAVEPEWIRLVYSAEIPMSVLQKEFVRMALAERSDTDAETLKAEFRQRKADELCQGLEIALNGRRLVLEDDPDQERVTRPNDEVFLLFRYHLRARTQDLLADQNRLVIRNANYRRRKAVFSHAVELSPGFGSLQGALETDTNYAIDPNTQIKWFFAGKHRDLELSFERGGSPVVGDGASPSGGTARATPDGDAGRLERYLMASGLSLRWVLMALAVAFVLGAGHALSPGHGKTVVAAYLVGSRGRVRDAVVLGITVTLTHTSSVFVLGLVTLFLSQYVLPETLYPYLSFLSGALVMGVGAVLLVRRVRVLRRAGSGHGGEHEHDHEHEHGHEHGHAHPVAGERVTFRSLVSLGISGGLVPCPSALVVLLAAIAYHRLLLGLGMVLSFSLGLAAVLIAIGVTMVLAGRWARKVVPSGRWLHWLPVGSAVVIVMLGAALCAKALLESGALSN